MSGLIGNSRRHILSCPGSFVLIKGRHFHKIRLCHHFSNILPVLVAQSDACLPGIQMVRGSILQSGKTFFRGDKS